VRKHLGWTSPMLREKSCVMTSMAPVTLAGVIVFLGFMWAGISFPISSFLVLVLEAYGLKLVHLPLHSIVTLAALVHLCEMFGGVRPSVMLLHHFFVLQPTGNNDVIDEHDF
jgi:hypothetical protein